MKPELESKSESARTGNSAAVPSTLSGVHVLVVDDNADARDLIATALVQAGARVTTAQSATDAATIATQTDVQVVLTDIAMPGTDGYQLLARIREHGDSRINRLPAIAITAYSSQPDRERIDRAGFDGLVVKPVPARDLVQAVASLMKDR